MKWISFLLLFTSTAFQGLAAEGVPSLKTGHTGPILSLAKDEHRQVLFTGGKDGSVRVWAGNPLNVLRKIQVSHLPIQAITVDPRNQRIGVIESNRLTQHFLSVWDWGTGIRRYQIPLAEFPLYVQFSPQGSFIGIGKPTWRSIEIYDADTGIPLPYLQEGFGIVNFFKFSASEKTFVTYSPSLGTLIYWNLSEGTRRATIRTVPGLQSLTVITERFAAGFDSRAIYLIDLVSGAAIDRVESPGISNIVLDSTSGELISFTPNQEAPIINHWRFVLPSITRPRGSLVLNNERQFPLPNGVSQILHFENRIVLGLAEGILGSMLPSSPFITKEGNQIIERISDLQVHEDHVLITTKRDLWMLPLSHLNSLAQRTPVPPFPNVRQIRNPYSRDLGILRLGSRIYLYSQDSEQGGLLVQFFPLATELQSILSFNLPLLGAWSYQASLYLLEKGGNILRFSHDPLKENLRIPAGDIHTLFPLGDAALLLGKSAIDFFGVPLVLLDLTTRETVPIPMPSVILVLKLLHQPSTDRVFLLTLRQSRERDIQTVLFMSNRANLEQFKPIAILPTEDVEADIVLDPDTEELLTTLGTGGIRKWDGFSWSSLESNNNLTSILRIHDNWIFSINKDGTCSIWNRSTGTYYGDLVFLRDGGWLILGRDGYAMAAPGVQIHKYLTTDHNKN